MDDEEAWGLDIPPDPAPNPSFRDEYAPHRPNGHPRPYNELKARRWAHIEFDSVEAGNVFIDELIQSQTAFLGDWSQLALLSRSMFDLDISEEQRLTRSPQDRMRRWNEWARPSCDRRPGWRGESIHLEHAHLATAKLQYVDLRHAHLEHSNCDTTSFEHARLLRAHLNNACLDSAFLHDATLHEVIAPGASFQTAKMTRAQFDRANLRGANLMQIEAQETIFRGADLSAAKLGEAVLTGAILQDADLSRAHPWGVVDLRFDSNRVVHTRIPGDAPDPWSVLRREYTGPWFFVHLLLLVLFFAPYAGKVLGLTAASNASQWIIEQHQAMLATEQQLQEGERSVATRGVHAISTAWSEQPKLIPAVLVLIGWTSGWWVTAMAAWVLIYNLFRAWLTLRVGMLRDAEERSGVTPSLIEYMGSQRLAKEQMYRMPIAFLRDLYKPKDDAVKELSFWLRPGLWRLHWITRGMFWIAASFVFINSIIWICTAKVPVL